MIASFKDGEVISAERLNLIADILRAIVKTDSDVRIAVRNGVVEFAFNDEVDP